MYMYIAFLCYNIHNIFNIHYSLLLVFLIPSNSNKVIFSSTSLATCGFICFSFEATKAAKISAGCVACAIMGSSWFLACIAVDIVFIALAASYILFVEESIFICFLLLLELPSALSVNVTVQGGNESVLCLNVPSRCIS